MRKIQVLGTEESGFRSLMTCDGWRVALFNAAQQEVFTGMHRHMETEEVFVLLRGKGVLIEAGQSERPASPLITELTPGNVYNVPRNVWHTHLLDAGAKVLIIENEDTNAANSATCQQLSALSQQEIKCRAGDNRTKGC